MTSDGPILTTPPSAPSAAATAGAVVATPPKLRRRPVAPASTRAYVPAVTAAAAAKPAKPKLSLAPVKARSAAAAGALSIGLVASVVFDLADVVHVPVAGFLAAGTALGMAGLLIPSPKPWVSTTLSAVGLAGHFWLVLLMISAARPVTPVDPLVTAINRSTEPAGHDVSNIKIAPAVPAVPPMPMLTARLLVDLPGFEREDGWIATGRVGAAAVAMAGGRVNGSVVIRFGVDNLYGGSPVRIDRDSIRVKTSTATVRPTPAGTYIADAGVRATDGLLYVDAASPTDVREISFVANGQRYTYRGRTITRADKPLLRPAGE